MGRALLEFLELAARTAGFHGLAYWFRDSPYVLATIIFGILGFIFVAWVLGNATKHPDDMGYDETALFIRGGCLAVVLGGLGLIFVAGVIWAWRYLFS